LPADFAADCAAAAAARDVALLNSAGLLQDSDKPELAEPLPVLIFLLLLPLLPPPLLLLLPGVWRCSTLQAPCKTAMNQS
jgi:hypothetical protein